MELTTNEAKDGTTGFEPYPSYSLGVLWNMKALTPEEYELAAVSPTPLDGDALARSAARNMFTAREWHTLRHEARIKLAGNHHEIARPNR